MKSGNGKKTPSSSRLQSVLYYGLAICAAGGTGGFIWQQSSKLDRETPEVTVTPPTTQEADDEPRTSYTLTEMTPREEKPSSSVRGEIMIRGKAGTTKALAPSTDRDRTVSVADNVPPPKYYPPAGGGAAFYVAEDTGRSQREAQSRADEERRQADKRAADADPKWQKRVTYK